MRYKPALLLFVLAMFVPELITGSTTLPAFINPAVIVLYALGYGLPVLLIRELAVRYNIGLKGTVFLGVAYGMLNEGLLARTMIAHVHLPVSQYDNYGYAVGISFPWTVGICLWHAFASVIFPISLSHYFFEEERTKPWLGNRLVVVLGVADILLACAVFLGKPQTGEREMPPQLGIILTMMLVLVVLAFAFKGCVTEDWGKPSIKPLLLGVSIFVPFNLVLAAIAGAKHSVLIFAIVLATILYLYSWIMKRFLWLNSPALLCFAIGWYLQNAMMSVVLLVLRNPSVGVISAAVDAIILGALWRQIKCKSQEA